MIPNRDTNYLINGSLDFAQRFPITVVPLTTTLAYLSDRWMFNYAGTWTVVPSWERFSADKPSSLSAFSNRLSAMQATDNTALVNIRQRVESMFARYVAGSKVSLTIKYKGAAASNFQQMKVTMATPTIIDNFAAVNVDFYDVTKNLSLNGSWQEIKFENITVPDTTVGTHVNIQLLNPAAPFATAFSLLIGEMKLSVGTKAQSFSLAGRNLNEEIRLCQKFHYRNNYAVNEYVAQLQCYSASLAFGVVFNLPIKMRTVATASSSPFGNFSLANAASATAVCNSLTMTSAATECVSISSIGRTGGGLVAGEVSVLYATSASTYISADAEL